MTCDSPGDGDQQCEEGGLGRCQRRDERRGGFSAVVSGKDTSMVRVCAGQEQKRKEQRKAARAVMSDVSSGVTLVAHQRVLCLSSVL